ncbi:hypothetical protein Tco_1554216, partial [Tanacetum coccineum]
GGSGSGSGGGEDDAPGGDEDAGRAEEIWDILYMNDDCPNAPKRVVNMVDKGKGASSGVDDDGFIEVNKKKSGDHDSDNEVEPVDNEMANYLLANRCRGVGDLNKDAC